MSDALQASRNNASKALAELELNAAITAKLPPDIPTQPKHIFLSSNTVRVNFQVETIQDAERLWQSLTPVKDWSIYYKNSEKSFLQREGIDSLGPVTLYLDYDARFEWYHKTWDNEIIHISVIVLQHPWIERKFTKKVKYYYNQRVSQDFGEHGLNYPLGYITYGYGYGGQSEYPHSYRFYWYDELPFGGDE